MFDEAKNSPCESRRDAEEDTALPYDAETATWLFDPEAIVSRNDVLYVTPSVEPWEAMPVGGGDLSAMVRWDGSLHLHLTKSDAWGFQQPPDAPPGSRFFNTVSPGHLTLCFGAQAQQAGARLFRQRLDLFHGRIVLTLGDEEAGARLSVWGHPTRKILVIEVTDPQALLAPARITLSEWRPTMQAGCTDAQLYAREIQTRAAKPHLASAGMQDYFDSAHDPLLGRGTAVMVQAPAVKPESCACQEQTATMQLPQRLSGSYCLLISAAVTPQGDPLEAARRELEEAAQTPLEQLRAEREAWWRDYWGRSFLRLQSQDGSAEWLTAAYHVHLYTLACVNRGPVPAKWDGGPGLLREDERKWGISEWVQEIRFTFLPLYAANRLEMAKGLPDFYSALLPYLEAQTRTLWGLDGLWIPETVTPWGHAEDWVRKADENRPALPHFHAWNPASAPYGRFERYNPYIGFLFTSGLEVCQHYLTYYHYTGDETFLRERAYPVLRGVCEFVANLLRRGDDGRYHLDPANALETWWMTRDPADTLDGIRAIFPEFIRLAEQYGQDADLRARCAERFAALSEPSTGLWTEDSRIAGQDCYAPAAAPGAVSERRNAENPALYRLFPFALSGIGSPDYARTRATFAQRICPEAQGWSLDAVWAARLGLKDEACALLAEHTRRFNRFRYGGWDSSDSNHLPGGLAVAPFMDAGGLSAFALQEVLLQSHNGLLRILPAAAQGWSGLFRLRAEGGFLVGVAFRDQAARFVEIESLLGNPCTLANPWETACTVRRGGEIRLQSAARTIVFPTERGQKYLVEPVHHPLAQYRPLALREEPHRQPGLPGRD